MEELNIELWAARQQNQNCRTGVRTVSLLLLSIYAHRPFAQAMQVIESATLIDPVRGQILSKGEGWQRSMGIIHAQKESLPNSLFSPRSNVQLTLGVACRGPTEIQEHVKSHSKVVMETGIRKEWMKRIISLRSSEI